MLDEGPDAVGIPDDSDNNNFSSIDINQSSKELLGNRNGNSEKKVEKDVNTFQL